MGNVALRTFALLHFHFLKVDWKSNVAYGAIRKSNSHGEIDHIFDMIRSHDALIVGSDIHVQPIERDILLSVGSNQIVKLQARECQHRLPIHLGVVQSVQQMNSAGT